MMAHGSPSSRVSARSLSSLTLLLVVGCAAPQRGEEPWQSVGALPAAYAYEPPRRAEDDAFASEGLYVGGILGAVEVYGDFEGDTVLVDDPMTPTTFVFIPELDAGGLYGLQVAYRWRRYEILVNWSMSQHDGSFQGVEHDTDFLFVDLLFKQYWFLESPLQPYIMAGFGVSEAKIDDGASDLVTLTEDATLEDGISIDVGAGLALYPSPWFSVFGQGMWRFSKFERADGIGGEFSIEGDLQSDSLELSVGANVRLLRPRD